MTLDLNVLNNKTIHPHILYIKGFNCLLHFFIHVFYIIFLINKIILYRRVENIYISCFYLLKHGYLL